MTFPPTQWPKLSRFALNPEPTGWTDIGGGILIRMDHGHGHGAVGQPTLVGITFAHFEPVHGWLLRVIGFGTADARAHYRGDGHDHLSAAGGETLTLDGEIGCDGVQTSLGPEDPEGPYTHCALRGRIADGAWVPA